MRWLSKYQGALTHSRLDRAVVARYFAFLVISQLVVFTLIGVIFSTYSEQPSLHRSQPHTLPVDSVKTIVLQIGHHESIKDILENLDGKASDSHRTVPQLISVYSPSRSNQHHVH